MIGKIKSWWSDRVDGVGKNLNMEIPIIQMTYDNFVDPMIISEIKDRVAHMFLEEHGEKIKKMILQDKNFADKVYNAIVLKKADKI